MISLDTAIAYAIAVVTGGWVVRMGMKNRRAGWVRERSNTMLDFLMAWARANAEVRNGIGIASIPAGAGPASSSLARDLSALHSAVAAYGTRVPASLRAHDAAEIPVRESARVTRAT